MQKVVLLIGVVCILLGLSYFGNKLRNFYEANRASIDPIVNLQSPTKQSIATIQVPYNDKTLLVSWFVVDNPNSISLYSNLDQEEDARTLRSKMACKYLVNGGFYSKDNKHIGGFVSEGESITKEQKNRLFNGVFSIGSQSAQIAGEQQESSRLAVQAGPILIKDNQIQELNLSKDSFERRTIVAVTDTGQIVFFTIYQKDSAYLGPKLGDLPNVIKEVEKKSGMYLSSALNLDGGTASAFLTDSLALGELSPIGSYFCIK